MKVTDMIEYRAVSTPQWEWLGVPQERPTMAMRVRAAAHRIYWFLHGVIPPVFAAWVYLKAVAIVYG